MGTQMQSRIFQVKKIQRGKKKLVRDYKKGLHNTIKKTKIKKELFIYSAEKS